MAAAQVEEYPVASVEGIPGGCGRLYRVILEFHQMDQYPVEAQMSFEKLEKAFTENFVTALKSAVNKALKKLSSGGDLVQARRQ